MDENLHLKISKYPRICEKTEIWENMKNTLHNT